jgi:hypothetical protein
LTSNKSTSKQESRLIRTLKTNYPDSLLSISNSLKKTDEQSNPLTFKPLKPIPSINSNNNNNSTLNNDDFINFVNSETESGLLNKSDESDAEGNKLHKATDSTKLAKLNIIATSIEQQIQSKVEQKNYERPLGYRFYNPPNIQKLLKKYSVF